MMIQKKENTHTTKDKHT